MGSIGDIGEYASIVLSSENPLFPIHLRKMALGDGPDPRGGRGPRREGIMQAVGRSPQLTESDEKHRDGGVSRRRDAIHDPMPTVGRNQLEAIILLAYPESDFDVAPGHLGVGTPLGCQACTRGPLVEQLDIDHRSIIAQPHRPRRPSSCVARRTTHTHSLMPDSYSNGAAGPKRSD